MKTILIDDDPLGMQGFELECQSLQGIELVGKFTSPLAALAYAKQNLVDFVLLDIDMPEMNGLEVFDALKKIRPDILVVFVTAYCEYAVDAMRKKADYIIFKPYDREEVSQVIARALLLQQRLQKRIYCRMFGRFDVFVDGAPAVFKSAKAKEIFALCVFRRGAAVSSEEIIDKLWPNYIGPTGQCSAFRFTVKQLADTLKQYRVQEVLGREKGLCYVNANLIASDYYSFLQQSPEALCEFQGEFLTDYVWAESEIFALSEKKRLLAQKAVL